VVVGVTVKCPYFFTRTTRHTNVYLNNLKNTYMKTLHESIDKKGFITKFIRLGNVGNGAKTFKIVYECTNGRSSLNVLIMSQDGEFKHIFNKYDLGDKFEFTASYVSDISKMEIDAAKGFKLMEQLIEKIYE
jgi:hypothetical protein